MQDLREDVPSSGKERETNDGWSKIEETDTYIELYNEKTGKVRRVTKEKITEGTERRLLMEGK